MARRMCEAFDQYAAECAEEGVVGTNLANAVAAPHDESGAR
jgi:hypothetical protein